MMLEALTLLVWAVSATTLELDLSRNGLETPPEDLCSRGLSVANFCGNKLTTAPPCCSSFRRLYLYRNNIQELPDDWLSDCSQLEEVSVSQNALRRLPPRLLSAARGLLRLQASRNLLDSLPQGLLRNATALRELDLSHNALVELPRGLLDTASQLVELFLQENSLSNLPENTLASCGSLRVLWLSHNRVTRLPKPLLAASPHLRTVRLDHNLIEDIAGGAFDNNPLLYFLDLSSNRLTSLPTGLFRKTTSLHRLLLSDNLLSVVPPAGSLPRQPAVIDLTYNLLQTVEDLDAFETSRVTLDYNLWCHDLIPGSQLSRLDGPERHRWFDQQRPVRYDRLTGRRVTAAGLLNCSTPAAAHEGRVTNADDATVDFNIAVAAPTDSPSTPQRIVAATTNIDIKNLKTDYGRATPDSKYTTTASKMPGSNTIVSEGTEATSNESTIDGIGGTETTATNVSSDILGTTQPE